MPPKKKKGGGDATPRSDDKPAAAAEAPDEPEDDTEEEAASGNKRDGADVSKVTDFVEQKELDSAKASKAIASITAEEQVDREAEAARERELAAVSIEQVRITRGVLACVGRASALSPRPCRRLTFFLSAPACPLAHTCALSRCHSRAQADVDLIATEMELDKAKAERTLREHKGDVVATLNTLVAA